MRQLLRISGVLALSVTTAAVAQTESPVTREGRYWVQTFNGAATALSLERMRLDTVGNVVVRGDGGDKVTYKLKARVRARDARAAAALLRQFAVQTRALKGWMLVNLTPPPGANDSPDLELSVPRVLQEVWISTRAGNVQASGLAGRLEAHSAAGTIGVDDVQGRAEIRTGGGDIQVGKVGGPVRCYSGAGVIRVQNAGGESWFETAGGEIFVHNVAGPVHAATAGGNIRIDRASGTVFARTAAGLIQVQQADGPVTAENSGGAIQVNAANGVRCDSSSGAIRLRNVGGAVRASTSSGNILAELLAGNRITDSSLSTNAGDITVFIASNLPMTVMARNESGGALGGIISDFPEIRIKSPGLAGLSPVLAQGALNGGGPVLHVNVIGGRIYLRRQK